jgi:hypothetical protein
MWHEITCYFVGFVKLSNNQKFTILFSFDRTVNINETIGILDILMLAIRLAAPPLSPEDILSI